MAGAAAAAVVGDEVEVRGERRGRWRRINYSVLEIVLREKGVVMEGGIACLLGVRLAGEHQHPHVCLRQLHTERCSGRLPALPDERVS